MSNHYRQRLLLLLAASLLTCTGFQPILAQGNNYNNGNFNNFENSQGNSNSNYGQNNTGGNNYFDDYEDEADDYVEEFMENQSKAPQNNAYDNFNVNNPSLNAGFENAGAKKEEGGNYGGGLPANAEYQSNLKFENSGGGMFNNSGADMVPATPMNSSDPQPQNLPAPDTAAAPEVVQPNAVEAPQDTPAEALPATASSPIEETNEFAGAPYIYGTRRNLAFGEGPEEYTVEEGDTLFDISDQLLDEASYWPKLWSFNPEIKNPHFIYPGVTLRFYPGDTETPPFLEVVTEDETIPVDKGEIKEKELVKEDISHLLLKQAAGPETEFVGPDDLAGMGGVENLISINGGVIDPSKLQVTVPAFIYGEDREPLGVVVGGVSGRMLIDTEDDIVIRGAGGLAAGSSYTVLRYAGEVRGEEEGYIGKRYEFVAHLNIKEKSAEDFWIGQVTSNRLGVQPGDILAPYRSTERIVSVGSVEPSSGTRVNEVIGFEYPDKFIGGKGSYVLLANGSQGLSQGQTVTIFQDINRSASTFVIDKLPRTSKPVAEVRIIDSTPQAAVGYVVSHRREIRLGDRAGS